MDYVFKNALSIKEIFHRFGFDLSNNFQCRIGYDGKIYILIETAGSRDDFMKYSVIILNADWDEEIVQEESCHFLGEYRSSYNHIQPIGDHILLVDCRCRYNNGNPEKNARIISSAGEMIDSFCLGDGIQDVYVISDQTIVTSYFDEGIFGNLGWDTPIGSTGLIIWNDKREQICHADHDICDCYAMNIDEQDNVWYYYYPDFKLVCLKSGEEKDWNPHISGSDFFILTEDRQSVIFDSDMINMEFMRNSLSIAMAGIMRRSGCFMMIRNFS